MLMACNYLTSVKPTCTCSHKQPIMKLWFCPSSYWQRVKNLVCIFTKLKYSKNFINKDTECRFVNRSRHEHKLSLVKDSVCHFCSVSVVHIFSACTFLSRHFLDLSYMLYIYNIPVRPGWADLDCITNADTTLLWLSQSFT